MTRGELWRADFGFPFGRGPGFRRPILIVQDDAFNESKINTIDFEEACAREQGEDSTRVAVREIKHNELLFRYAIDRLWILATNVVKICSYT